MEQAGKPPVHVVPHLQGVSECHATGLRPDDGADPHSLRPVPALVADDQGLRLVALEILNLSPRIQGTANRHPRFVQNMGIDHRCLHGRMAQQLLDRSNVVPRLQQMRRETVAERMRSYPLCDLRTLRPPADRRLECRILHMVAPAYP